MDAATPRAHPVYAHPFCRTCGTKLELSDVLSGETDPDAIWYDEWECPKCRDGITMDWPQEQIDELRRAFENAAGDDLEEWL